MTTISETAATPHITYFAYDVEDAAVARRVRMLRSAGATVDVLGFHRAQRPPEMVEGCPVTDLGRTAEGRLLLRLVSVARALWRLPGILRNSRKDTVFVARNLECLSLAVFGTCLPGRAGTRIAYEVLDIHRRMVGSGLIARTLRAVEARLLRFCALVVVSSSAFKREYFDQCQPCALPFVLIENKVFTNPRLKRPAPSVGSNSGPLVIGWQGILRCRKSLLILLNLTRKNPEQLCVHIRGKVAVSAIPDFHELLAGQTAVKFLGAYRSPDDLATLHEALDFVWAIDFFEEGFNSEWLLPNRLYEACFFGVPPVVVDGTETACWLERSGAGIRLDRDTLDAIDVAHTFSRSRRAQAAQYVTLINSDALQTSEPECRELLSELLGERSQRLWSASTRPSSAFSSVRGR